MDVRESHEIGRAILIDELHILRRDLVREVEARLAFQRQVEDLLKKAIEKRDRERGEVA
jgi:hypothetical protein